MSGVLLVDTDILIDAARGSAVAVEFLDHKEDGNELAVSSVSVMELMVGCRNKRELAELERFLKRLLVLQISEDSSALAMDLLKRYRLSHGLLIPDALIAATALSRKISFATKNRADFRFIAGLELVAYS